MTTISRIYSIDQCRVNPKALFIFGDNTRRSGMGGQAIIREQPNAIGIATKLAPSADKMAYFTDKDYDSNIKTIDGDITRVKEYFKEKKFKDYVFPQMGLGTGRADMPRKCPRTFLYLSQRLLEEFQFNNVEFLFSKEF